MGCDYSSVQRGPWSSISFAQTQKFDDFDSNPLFINLSNNKLARR